MKKFLLILIMSTVAFAIKAQVELKGIQLGEVTKADASTQTLIGENYYIFTKTLNDGRCCTIGAIPAKDENIRNISYSELKTLIAAVNKKYGVTLKFTAKSKYKEEEGWYTAEKEGVKYLIAIKDHNQFRDNPYDISFLIYNIELQKIHEAEEQEKANNDM